MNKQEAARLILQPTPPPGPTRRPRKRPRSPDGRLLTAGDRRWLEELEQLAAGQQAAHLQAADVQDAEVQAAQQSSPPA